MNVMRADERKIFATTKGKFLFSNVYSCCRSHDDIMRASDVVFGGKRWSRRFLSLRHLHSSFMMQCSFTNRCRLLVDDPRLRADGLVRLHADGPWSFTDGPWSSVVVCGWPLVPKTGCLCMACGRLRMARGRLRTICGRLRMVCGRLRMACGARMWLIRCTTALQHRVVVMPIEIPQ